MAGLFVLACCAPDLANSVPPCLAPETVSCDQAPLELKTSSFLHSVDTFESLAGRWTASLECPSRETPSDVDLTFQPAPSDQIAVVVGSKPNPDGSPGMDCIQRGSAMATAHLTLTSAALPGLDGQSSEMRVSIQLVPDIQLFDFGIAVFDASYDPGLRNVSLTIQLATDRVPHTDDEASLGIHFERQPQHAQQGNAITGKVEQCGGLLRKVSN